MNHEDLVKAALAARDKAYAPYSDYQVGAAIVAGGKLYVGANIENCSYGLTVCAERNAIAAAVMDGQLAIQAVAVVTSSDPPASPCGACRQVLLEFSPDLAAVTVILAGTSGARRVLTLADLIPDAFSARQLDRP